MNRFLISFLLFAAFLICAPTPAAELSADTITCDPGEEITAEIWLLGAVSGLSGYIMTPVLSGDTAADVLFTPAEFFALSDIDSESKTASAVDLLGSITTESAKSDPILLGTVLVSGTHAGEMVLSFDIREMTDDFGNPIEVSQKGINIIIGDGKSTRTMIGLDVQPSFS
jgi:hypothetical protein